MAGIELPAGHAKCASSFLGRFNNQSFAGPLRRTVPAILGQALNHSLGGFGRDGGSVGGRTFTAPPFRGLSGLLASRNSLSSGKVSMSGRRRPAAVFFPALAESVDGKAVDAIPVAFRFTGLCSCTASVATGTALGKHEASAQAEISVNMEVGFFKREEIRGAVRWEAPGQVFWGRCIV